MEGLQYVPPYYFAGLTRDVQNMIVSTVKHNFFEGKIKNKSLPYKIRQLVCEAIGLEENIVTSKTKKREYVFARYIIIHEVILNCEWLSLRGVASVVGSNDHSTAIHANREYLNLVDNFKPFQTMVAIYNESLKEYPLS